jgi:hypothetical protein
VKAKRRALKPESSFEKKSSIFAKANMALARLNKRSLSVYRKRVGLVSIFRHRKKEKHQLKPENRLRAIFGKEKVRAKTRSRQRDRGLPPKH